MEDEEPIREEIQESLSSEGYAVFAVETVQEMHEVLDERKIDLLVTDLMLREGSCLDAIKQIRMASDIPIIIVSGRSSDVDKIVGLEIGADDYVGKPFNPRELLARVSSVLRRARMRSVQETEPSTCRGEDFSFDGWTVNFVARKVSEPRGREIELTTSEFDLFSHFVRHPNQVLTRDQLLDAVRGPDWYGYDRTIDGLVSRLRKKIAPNTIKGSYFKTIRGIGYMFVTS